MSASLYETPADKISQGDVFEDVPHHYLTSSANDVFDNKQMRARGILLTHDCDVDKERIERWTLCPVLPLHKLGNSGAQGDVRRNRIFPYFFLPRHGAIEEDSFVDFQQVSSIDKNIIIKLNRIVSLSDEGRRAFYAQHIRFVTRWQLKNVACPKCGTSFNPSDGLPVRPQ